MNRVKRITKLLNLVATPKQFNQLLLEAKTNPATLSKDLKFCMKAKIVARKVKTSAPIRCEYSITELGEEFYKCFELLDKMGV